MTQTRWNFTTGTNGDTVTGANTGSNGVVLSGGTGTLSNAQTTIGTFSALMTATSTSGVCYWQKTGMSTSALNFDLYLYVTAAPSSAVSIAWAGTGSREVSLELNSNRTLTYKNASYTSVWTSTYAIPLNTWVRVAAYFTQNSSTGTARVVIESGGSTQDDSTLLTSQNTGASAYTDLRLGSKCSTGTQTLTQYIDSWSYDPAATGLPDGVGGSVTAVPATGSGQANAPTVSGSIAANVAAVAATATGIAVAPQVEGQVVVSGGGPMTATGSMLAPIAIGGAQVAAVTTTGSGQANAPAVTGGAQIAAVVASGAGSSPAPTVTGGAQVVATTASGAGLMPAPVVDGSSASEVLAVAAIGSGQMLAPTVTGVRVANVAAVAATSSGSMPAPTVTGGAALTTVVMTATGAAVAPVVVGGVAGTAQAVTATATGQMPSPSVAAERWADVAAAPGLATALMLAPVVLGGAQVSPPAMACAGSLPSPVVAGHGPYNFQRVAKRTFTVSQGTRTYKVRRQR